MTRKLALVALVALAVAVPVTRAVASGPSITGFSPASGPVGTVVTITGSGFSPGPVTVAFNGVTAPNPQVNATGTQIRVAVPPFATSGRITVADPTGAHWRQRPAYSAYVTTA